MTTSMIDYTYEESKYYQKLLRKYKNKKRLVNRSGRRSIPRFGKQMIHKMAEIIGDKWDWPSLLTCQDSVYALAIHSEFIVDTTGYPPNIGIVVAGVGSLFTIDYSGWEGEEEDQTYIDLMVDEERCPLTREQLNKLILAVEAYRFYYIPRHMLLDGKGPEGVPWFEYYFAR